MGFKLTTNLEILYDSNVIHKLVLVINVLSIFILTINLLFKALYFLQNSKLNCK